IRPLSYLSSRIGRLPQGQGSQPQAPRLLSLPTGPGTGGDPGGAPLPASTWEGREADAKAGTAGGRARGLPAWSPDLPGLRGLRPAWQPRGGAAGFPRCPHQLCRAQHRAGLPGLLAKVHGLRVPPLPAEGKFEELDIRRLPFPTLSRWVPKAHPSASEQGCKGDARGARGAPGPRGCRLLAALERPADSASTKRRKQGRVPAQGMEPATPAAAPRRVRPAKPTSLPRATSLNGSPGAGRLPGSRLPPERIQLQVAPAAQTHLCEACWPGGRRSEVGLDALPPWVQIQIPGRQLQLIRARRGGGKPGIR
ncbi:hypothetical protein P7K49_010319, partial [Saguinus oedipus]